MEDSNVSKPDHQLLLLHKVITRSLNLITKYSLGAGVDDLLQDGYRMLVRAFMPVVLTHFTGEEELLYPAVMANIPDGPYDLLREQHSGMRYLLQKFNSWQGMGTSAWEAGNMAELHQSSRSLYTLWHAHLKLEAGVLGQPGAGKSMSAEASAALAGQLADHMLKFALPSEITIPFMIYNLFPADREEFTRFIPKQVLFMVHNGWHPEWTPMIPYLLD